MRDKDAVDRENLLARLKGGLIVSCQASEGPLHGSIYMAAMAQAAVLGGAVGIRANGAGDVSAISRVVDVPIIGINKQQYAGSEVYITPTLSDALPIVDAGAEIVAVDGTDRPRPNGETLSTLIRSLHETHNVLVMADISTVEEGLRAAHAGADIVASTLSGYTPYSPKLEGPDLDLIAALSAELSVPVIGEGRYHMPEQVVTAFDRGAFAVVIGRAITAPQQITANFVTATPRGQ